MPRESIQTLSMITHNKTCLVPRRLSFDENVRAKEGGKETTGETCRLYPSHGPLRFITSHSFRAHLAKNEAPKEEADKFFIIFKRNSYYCSFKHPSARTANLPLVKSQNRLAVRVIFGIK